MSRWSRRTQEEKEQIQRDQDEQRLKIQKREQRHEIDNQDIISEIYEKREIPIYCMKCGWTTSQKYILCTKPSPLGGEAIFVQGKCKDCGRRIERMIVFNSTDVMMFSLSCSYLKINFRLEDRRKKNEIKK